MLPVLSMIWWRSQVGALCAGILHLSISLTYVIYLALWVFECVTLPTVVYTPNDPNLKQFYCCAVLGYGDRASCRTQTIGTDRQNEISRCIKAGITHRDYWGVEMELRGYVGHPVV